MDQERDRLRFPTGGGKLRRILQSVEFLENTGSYFIIIFNHCSHFLVGMHGEFGSLAEHFLLHGRGKQNIIRQPPVPDDIQADHRRRGQGKQRGPFPAGDRIRSGYPPCKHITNRPGSQRQGDGHRVEINEYLLRLRLHDAGDYLVVKLQSRSPQKPRNHEQKQGRTPQIQHQTHPVKGIHQYQKGKAHSPP